jgi:hypothetical protein
MVAAATGMVAGAATGMVVLLTGPDVRLDPQDGRRLLPRLGHCLFFFAILHGQPPFVRAKKWEGAPVGPRKGGPTRYVTRNSRDHKNQLGFLELPTG